MSQQFSEIQDAGQWLDCWCYCSYLRGDVQGLDQIYLIYYYAMEKLLELLNEYEKVIWTDRVWWWAIDDGAFFCTRKSKKGNLIVQHSSEDEAILWIISKKFWFIERLIANDKLDKEWLFNIIRESCIFDEMNICSESDYIIMYLAIGYNPIYFLTSMVK